MPSCTSIFTLRASLAIRSDQSPLLREFERDVEITCTQKALNGDTDNDTRTCHLSQAKKKAHLNLDIYMMFISANLDPLSTVNPLLVFLHIVIHPPICIRNP